MKLPHDPAIPLLGIYQRKKNNLKSYMHLYVNWSIIYISQGMEAM